MVYVNPPPNAFKITSQISPKMLSIIIYSNIQSIDKYFQSRKPIPPKTSNIRSEIKPTAEPAQSQMHHTT